MTASVAKQPVIAAIGGFDPSGGAGILADIKTISALGCYGVAAITSNTVQNTKGVLAAHPEPADVVVAQIQALLEDFDVSTFKTGMLPTGEIIKKVSEILRAQRASCIVVDPVLRSTSGFNLVEGSSRAMTENLFPISSLVTPNAREAAEIAGIDVVDEPSMEEAGKRILEMGPGAVLVKGGDMTGPHSIDILIDAEGVLRLSSPRIRTTNTHGTGCTLASAIACGVALGKPLRDAVRDAKDYVLAAIASAPGLGKGFGPLNHCPFRTR